MGVTRVGSLILIGVLFTISFTVLTLYLRTGTEAVYQRLMINFKEFSAEAFWKPVLTF